MKRIDSDHVNVTRMAKERFDDLGYLFKDNGEAVAFHSRDGKTLFEIIIGEELDDITILTQYNSFYTNQLMITCDSDGTPTLYFNSEKYGLILLNIDIDGSELMFLM